MSMGAEWDGGAGGQAGQCRLSSIKLRECTREIVATVGQPGARPLVLTSASTSWGWGAHDAHIQRRRIINKCVSVWENQRRRLQFLVFVQLARPRSRRRASCRRRRIAAAPLKVSVVSFASCLLSYYYLGNALTQHD
jgi:hypothetical protein